MPPSPLVSAHIEAERRLRLFTTNGITRLWRALPDYRDENIPQWLESAVPFVLAAQRQSAALTDAFIARSLERQPIGIDPELVIGAAVRNGTPPDEAYRRPFVTVWTSLAAGAAFPNAANAGLARATGMAATDVQTTMRATAQAVQDASPDITGWQRVANPGACVYCAEIDGALLRSADAAALHANCGCSIEPLTEPIRSSPLPSAVAVRQHGETGATLGSPDHAFTSPSDLN